MTLRKHCRHCTASRKRRTRSTMKIGRKVPPHGGNGKLPGGIPIMRLHHKDGLNTDRTVKSVYSMNQLFICGMNVIFACKPIHLKDDFFRTTQLDHRLSEELVTDKSIVNVFVAFLSTPSLMLICRVVFFATFFLPVPVTVWSALPDVKVRDREEIQHGRDVLLIYSCIILQEGVHMCSIQCQRSNTLDMLCIVISAPRRLSRIIQCSQQL